MMNQLLLLTIQAVPVRAATGAEILQTVANYLKGGVGFLGAAMVIFGAVTIGINVHNGASGNGSAIASGVGVLIGGAIVSAAAIYFAQLDMSWANQ